MKQLDSFIALNVNGGDRISYTYDVIDSKTGDFISRNIKEGFNVVDETLREHVNAIRDYIRKNKLSE